MGSLCGCVGVGVGGGGGEGDSPPFVPSSCPTPLDACRLRATPFIRWSPWRHVKTLYRLR